MNRFLFLLYILGILAAFALTFAGHNLWVLGTVVAVYALTHLSLRHIDQKETQK